MVAVAEDGHDSRAPHAGGVVEHRICEAVGLELLHPGAAPRDHVVFRAELEAAGGAGLYARGLQARLDPVHAQRAFGHLAGLGVELRYVEGAARRAEAAADARLR